VTSSIVSVVLLTNSKEELLSGVVDSILSQDYRAVELIVVVNGPHPVILEVLSKYSSRVRVIVNGRNRGFAAGMNQGVAAATGGFVYITANDIELAPNYLSELVRTYCESGEWGLLAGVWYNFDAKDQVVGAGGSLVFTPWPIPRVMETVLDSRRPYDVEWIAGASIFTTTAVWRHFGGYRESFFFHSEDVELALRVRRTGGFVRVVPTARLYHHEHDRTGSLTVEYYKLRNFAAISVLYGPPAAVPLFVPKFLLGLARRVAVHRRSAILYVRTAVGVLSRLPGWLLERAFRRRPSRPPAAVTAYPV
jgi:GT2 family glycosyltransferase